MKKYAVDVHWVLAKCYLIKANSPEEAEKKINDLVNSGEVSVHTDRFETTDIDVECSGEENEDGEIEYYE